jgi:hypothetical protein
MGWFTKKPTEDELERSVLFAAMLAKGNERDKSTLTTNDEIYQFLDHAFKELGVKPGQQERQISAMGVQALLTESNFINEALDYRLAHDGVDMPPSFRGKMLAAMEKTVGDFMEKSGQA